MPRSRRATQARWSPRTWAAISLAQLNELRDRAKQELGEDFWTATMYDVNQRILQPLCDEHKKPYAHIVNGSQPRHVDVFVSHAWRENFNEFVTSVNAAFLHGTVKPNVWICALALIQSTDPAVVASQVGLGDDPSQAPFTRALSKADKVLVVRNTAVDLYDRIWCCWELFVAYQQGHMDRPGAIMVTGLGVFCSDQEVDISCACASDLEDKRKILAHIVCTKRNYHEINQKLTEIRNFLSA